MKNIKKLLVYPLAFVLFFGLTANECLDAVENIAVDVPTEFEETFTIQVPEAGVYTYPHEIDLNSPEVQEYRDRLESFEVSAISFEVTDNIATGSSLSKDTKMVFSQARTLPFPGTIELKEKLESLTLNGLEVLKEYLEDTVVKPADASNGMINLELVGEAVDGPIDITVTMTINGTLKASAN
ncbi:hypothetical protein [Marivirga sp.]|uniref:hypothetical protein n=1 Tax=Marivirga sp. TaxID=2018662 RepID=UPI002D80EDC2|nr:hypothetical protein [Marivirga sp.]HET8860627.1 hypothetical protein [Marivirga sp.]